MNSVILILFRLADPNSVTVVAFPLNIEGVSLSYARIHGNSLYPLIEGTPLRYPVLVSKAYPLLEGTSNSYPTLKG